MNVNSDYYIHDILEKEVKPAFSRMQTSTDLTAIKLFPATVKGCFIHQSLQSSGWMQILNTTFHRRTGCSLPNSLDLSPIENVWSIMATARRLCRPRASVIASIKAPYPKSMEINFSVNTSKVLSVRFLTDWKQPLKTVKIPFHTNSEHGQRHRLTLTFIGPLLCNFNGGLI